MELHGGDHLSHCGRISHRWSHLEFRRSEARDAAGWCDSRSFDGLGALEAGYRDDVAIEWIMSFYNGILNLTNWTGNVIMPTLGGLFIALAVIQFARGYHHLYSTWAYGGLMCLVVSGLLRLFEKFTGQAGWNNPDLIGTRF